MQVEYIGFTIEDQFVVGYGLDYAEKYRNLPYIAVLERAERWLTCAFDIITEADARQIEPAPTVELAAGGHVTPLARDTLTARRVTVVPAGSVDPRCRRPGAGGRHPARRDRQRSHRRGAQEGASCSTCAARGLAVDDLGTDGTAPVDYPDMAARVASAVARGEADAGIVIDGAGIGSAIAANKVKGIRAAMCTDETIARYSREHNGANVMTLGSTLLAGHRRGAAHRRRLDRHADEGGALHPAAAEDPAAGGDRF